MQPFVSWSLYFSWAFLFICLLCTLKWIHMQPCIIQQRNTTATASTTGAAMLDKQEKVVRFAIKFLLGLSVICLVLHFVFLVNS